MDKRPLIPKIEVADVPRVADYALPPKPRKRWKLALGLGFAMASGCLGIAGALGLNQYIYSKPYGTIVTQLCLVSVPFAALILNVCLCLPTGTKTGLLDRVIPILAIACALLWLVVDFSIG
jgi:hypothetical protein